MHHHPQAQLQAASVGSGFAVRDSATCCMPCLSGSHDSGRLYGTVPSISLKARGHLCVVTKAQLINRCLIRHLRLRQTPPHPHWQICKCCRHPLPVLQACTHTYTHTLKCISCRLTIKLHTSDLAVRISMLYLHFSYILTIICFLECWRS